MTLRSYPFSTGRGIAIPLDAAQPLRSFLVDTTVGTYLACLAAGEVISLVANVDCRVYIGFSTTPVMSDQPLSDSFYMVAGTAATLVVSGPNLVAEALSIEGTLLVTVIEPWRSVANVYTLEEG